MSSSSISPTFFPRPPGTSWGACLVPDLRWPPAPCRCDEHDAPLGSCRYHSLLAAYGEAKRERYLSELAQLEEDVHLARTHARDKLDRFALQHVDTHALRHAVGVGGTGVRLCQCQARGLMAGAVPSEP